MIEESNKQKAGKNKGDKKNTMEHGNSKSKKKAEEMTDFRDSRRSAIEAAIQKIEKEFGKGSVMKYGPNQQLVKVEVVSSGSLSLDIALGIGGYPRGRIIEIFGPEMSGKTTLALHAIAEAQKLGGACCLVDTEHAFDQTYASNIGVKFDEGLFYSSQPTTGEEALEIIDNFVRSAAFDVIVLDSVAALVPKAELEGDMGDPHMGLQARLMSQALRKLAGSVSKSSCIVIFINQIRQKIGVVFGNPETTTGGNALKFYASIRLDVRRSTAIKSGEKVVGHEMDVKIIKNKLAPPFRKCRLQIIYGEGVSRASEVLELGVEHGFIQKSGAWYSINGEKIGQGAETSKNYLLENPSIMNNIENSIKKALLKEHEAKEIDEEMDEEYDEMDEVGDVEVNKEGE